MYSADTQIVCRGIFSYGIIMLYSLDFPVSHIFSDCADKRKRNNRQQLL
nr:MAG TPA: hypothetical protein [Caudoviricetes sp.]